MIAINKTKNIKHVTIFLVSCVHAYPGLYHSFNKRRYTSIGLKLYHLNLLARDDAQG